LAGCVLGYVIWEADHGGYFVTWEELPIPPFNAEELITSREFDLYVGTADGRSMHWDGYSWEVTEVPEGFENGWTVIRPCRSEWPQFWPLSHPPSDIKDCIQDQGMYIEGYNKHVYVLDEQGNIWQWNLLTNGLVELISLGIYPCTGGVFGLLFAAMTLLVIRLRGMRPRLKTSPLDAEAPTQSKLSR
jgi:hypothetical protein